MDDSDQDQREKLIQLILEIRRRGVTDTRVLSAVEKVPREAFVSRHFKDRAYENVALPIECGQTISEPHLVAYMISKADVGERHRVLEIGTGSGYAAAVLSHLCRRVYTIERHPSLQKAAETRLRDLGYDNVTTLLGDGTKGWPAQAPFDRIIVSAGGELPEALKDQLTDEGILIAPVGESSENQRLVRIRRVGSTFAEEDLLPVRFVPLLKGVAAEP